MRANPRTMLPLLVTQIPLSIAAAVAWVLLYAVAFPDVEVDSGSLFTGDAPRRLILWIVVISWSHALFTLVGVAAAILAVRSVVQGRPQPVTASLDPPFTRLGGLLVIFAILQGLLVAGAALFVTLIGLLLALFVGLRLGMVLHTYILEEVGVGTAVRRSWQLMRGNVFRLLGAVIMVVPVMFATLAAATLVLVLLLIPFYSEDPSRNVALIANAGVFLALGAALIPTGTYFAATTTLLYYRIGGAHHDRSPARN